MELMALDKDFQIINMIVPTNIQWNSRYYECGDFSISLPVEQYSNDMKYIYTKDREETGIINKAVYSYAEKGKQIQISGFFLEKVLDDKIAHPTFYGSGEITSTLAKFVNTYKEDIPLNVLSTKDVGSRVDFQETGAQIGLKLYEILATQEMSYKIVYDFVSNKLNLQFYKGLDRTQSQTTNNFIVFSTNWNNITEVNADIDDSNYKNYAVIGGSGEGTERIYEYLDLSNGGYKKKIFIDEKGTSYDPKEQTLAQYKLELRQKGIEKMLGYGVVNNFIFKPKGDSYEYLKDYKKGDKCDVLLQDIGVEIEVQIINVYEVFKDNQQTIELEFGNTKIKGVM